jgi:hypothetical protein
MNFQSSESHPSTVVARFRALWLDQQSNPVVPIMSSPGSWDSCNGEQREIMAGVSRPELEPVPYLMSSAGTPH